MKKFALALSLLILPLLTVPALTSCNTEPDYIKQVRQQEEDQKKADDATIQAYLTRHSITNYTRLPSGIYLVPLVDGPTTNSLIKAGNKVTTNFVSKYIGETNEGQVLVASSSNRTPCGCISFYANQPTPEAPTGYQQGVLQMRKGDRKQVIIPSFLLVYGGGSYYQSLVPNTPPTPLLFDIEVTEVQ
ncbi:FKBP-type peptidyl-prolyl cis-trans isomerase [Hymenobacter sublimis]|uniref:peptidylprolyl isomerase n=1 Tax=Hymenobacter sublimis TaxID=2933777 RepID=A0ABY4JC79_9BACT|nr:FKBP-type peptidyl-prolyl cis-trans isomerase [Hymenobacter sublimis]UPL49563.1 FKBP-type peptidyl-prolyl cis-trans isomerase [Hymenobacter sublimis]